MDLAIILDNIGIYFEGLKTTLMLVSSSLLIGMFVAIPTAILWWLDRRYRKGCCQKCGYNLTGNVSGTCPECGTPT